MAEEITNQSTPSEHIQSPDGLLGDVMDDDTNPRYNTDTFFYELQALRRLMDISNQQTEALKEEIKAIQVLVTEHDKILIRGNGTPSMQETVRRLSEKVDKFLEAHEQEKKERKEEANRWKWAIIGVGLPVVTGLVIQMVVFWIRFEPLLAKMATP